MRNGDSASDTHRLFRESAIRITALVLLLSVGAVVESFSLSSLRNPEIWGNLRIGSWILENKSWPQTGLFSQAANLPWRDFSWGYDALAAIVYKLMGLRAVPGLLVCFRLALAAITFLLAGGRRNFWSAVGLSAVAQYVLGAIGPDAACVSVIFFGIELFLLLALRRSANRERWFVFPVLFFLWANLDIGFIYGIALYVLFLIVVVSENLALGKNWQWIQNANPDISLEAAALTGIASVVATLLNPYGYHAYGVFLTNQLSPVNSYLPAYASMRFHQPQDYVLLLLTMTAFLGLGLRRTRDMFQIAALAGCAILAFHSQRDNWLVTLAAVAMIGEVMLQGGKSPARQSRRISMKPELIALVSASAIVLLAFFLRVPRAPEVLIARIAKSYPVQASDYIRRHQLSPPLFNTYEWGSFLTWYLPEYPVAIDGRRGLYIESEQVDYFKVMKADIPYQVYPPMKLARTLLLDKTGIMGDALRSLPGFEVAYEDEISIVLLQTPKE
jgi:hypothetical protein